MSNDLVATTFPYKIALNTTVCTGMDNDYNVITTVWHPVTAVFVAPDKRAFTLHYITVLSVLFIVRG